ncbi:MAG: T6SS effector amidase Tae4 family protein [Flavobacterium sp.]|nr:T6SS effector amidase Tae4 family protein [Flavobacterium sp.]
MKKLSLLLILLLAALFFSCEKDLYEEPLRKKERPNLQIEMKPVNRNSEIIKKLRKKLPSKLTISDNARAGESLLTLEGDFGKVKLESVLEVANQSEKAYSFEVDETVKDPNKYLNLVIDKNDIIWLYKVEKLVQQYKNYPINSERLVKYKLNGDLTYQSSTPCDTIVYPPFQPDPVNNPSNGGGGGVTFPGGSNWQNNPIGGGFFPPITNPGGSSESSGSSGSGGSGGEIVNVIVAVGDAISDAWNWFINLFSSPPGTQASGCGCSHKQNVVVVDPIEDPCNGDGGYIAIIPQSPIIDKINELDIMLSDQLTYDDKIYLYTNGVNYLDYFYNLAQNPPVGYDVYNILPGLITHVRTTGNFEFVEWANNYLINHPTVTWQKFRNWFMTPREGIEDNESINLSDLNLTFAPQNLPTFDDFLLAFPSHLDSNFETAQQVYTSIGGNVLTKYNQGARNTCALRVSRGLNYSGVTIPNIPGVTVKGADNKNYFLVAKNLLSWMKSTFGTPTGSNHLTGADGGEQGVNFPNLLSDKQGIYIMIPSDPSSSGFDASGHADMFFSGDCDGGCYFNATGGVSEIFFWELN